MESRWIDLDGPVHYLDYEGPRDGPTFVLVHGLGGSYANWLALAPELARRGRVLVPDLIGFGRTPLERRGATVQQNRRLIDRLIEALVAEPVIVIGNSMGGAISILQASVHPEVVAGLVLVNPALPRSLTQGVDRTVAGLFATYMIPRVGEAFIQRRLAVLGPERIAEETLRLCCVDPGRVPADVREAGIALARERATMPWATTAFLQATRSLIKTLAARRRFAATIADIAAPTLLIHGRWDRLVPVAAAEAVAALRPDWDVTIFEHLGHVPMLEDAPATVEAIERWMDGPTMRLFVRRPARGSARRRKSEPV